MLNLRKKITLFALAIFSLTLIPTGKVNAATNTTTNSSKEVIAYFPNWGIYNGSHQSMQVGQIPWDKVTYINHSFFTVDKSFKLVSTDQFADFDKVMAHGEGWAGLNGHMAEYKYYKTLYPNVKVMISVGGWTRGENFHEMAKTPASRKVFIDSCVEFLKKYPFIDGIDIDWEYPGVNRAKDPNDQYDYGCPGGPEDKENFPALLKELKDGFKAAGLPDKKLTAAVAAGKDKIDIVPPSLYAQYLDLLNVMTYDMHGSWDNVTGHHSPLYGTPYQPYDNNINTYYNVDAAMKLYVDAGVPKNKLVVGTPFYSRGWKGVDMTKGLTIDGKFYPGLHQPANAAWTGIWDNPSVPGGQEPWFKLKQLETTAGWEKYRDPKNGSPYLINKTSGAFLTYEDETSLTQKLDYINTNGFGGVIIWELSGDDISNGYPLTSLCYNKLIGGGGVTPPGPTAPLKANLTVDNANNTGSFTLTGTIPANSNGTTYELYEGTTIIKTGSVNSASSTFSHTITNKAVGSYNYKVILRNTISSSESNIVNVTVSTSTTPSGDAWTVGTTYKAGDIVTYSNAKYKCVIGHTALDVWTPNGGGATLWQKM